MFTYNSWYLACQLVDVNVFTEEFVVAKKNALFSATVTVIVELTFEKGLYVFYTSDGLA